MPEAKLSWHLPKSISYLSKNDYALITDQSLRNSISNLTFLPSRSYDGKLIQCQAHSSAIDIINQTMITQQYIQTICKQLFHLFFINFSVDEILVPPEINISLIGQQIENGLIYIYCNVQSRPNLNKIQWFNGTYPLNVTDKNRLAIHLTRFMHKNKITCQATNQVGTRNQSIALQVNCTDKFFSKTILQLIVFFR